MARFIKQGNTNSLSGLIGNVVVVDGKIVRSRPKRTKKKATPNEKHNQSKFKLLGAFIKRFYGFMKPHFTDLQGKETARDAIRSYHLRHATIEEEGFYVINYPKVLMSTGRLRSLHAAQVVLQGQLLAVDWEDNSNQALAAATDALSVIAYNTNTEETYFFEACATRGDAGVQLSFPSYFSTAEVHLWATFEDPVSGSCSNSEYLGLMQDAG